MHLSTARDMTLIARHAMTLPTFREIVSKEYYKNLPATNKHNAFPDLRNTNKLLWPQNKYTYSVDGKEQYYVVNGIKTGYTSRAGNNIISAATDDNGMELVAVVLHVMGGNENIFSTTKELFRYGFEHYSNQSVMNANEFIKTINVEDAIDSTKLDLISEKEVKSALPLDKNKWNIVKKENLKLPIKAPVKKGDTLGYLEIENNGYNIGRIDIIAAWDVNKSKTQITIDTTKQYFNTWTGILSCVIFIILISGITLLKIKAQRKAQKKTNRKI